MPPAAPQIDRRASLDGVPVLNHGVRLKDEPDGRVLVTVELARRTGFWARFQQPVNRRRLRLDELGSFVVRQIDGRRSVRQIIEAFVGRYRTNRREAELSTADFLRTLARRRVISVVIK